tara:strand:+ start:606 stop:1277 length:672 start_codon:yes stop_codon:yes gene_type:complete
MNIAIIPARSGSKRIKNKNILLINKKPMIYYSIKAAQKAKIFDEIIVSTDSLKIKKIAEKYGAKVPKLRSKKLSNNKTPLIDVINFTFKEYDEKVNICCIYPAAIFIKASLLKDSYKKYINSKKKFCLSVNMFPSYIEKSFKLKGNKIKYNFSKYKNVNSNKFKNSYYDAGQFFWGKPKYFLKKLSLFSNDTFFYKLNNIENIDVNTLSDIKNIKFLAKCIKL